MARVERIGKPLKFCTSDAICLIMLICNRKFRHYYTAPFRITNQPVMMAFRSFICLCTIVEFLRECAHRWISAKIRALKISFLKRLRRKW